MRQRRFLRLLLLLALSLGGLSLLLAYNWLPFFSQSPAALAHAFVIGSDPIDGSTVSAAPTVVRIFFNEDISPASVAHVYFGPDYRSVDADSSVSTTNPRELDTPLISPDRLPQGSYTVRWTALANGDGHTTQGVIGFNVGHSSVGLPGEVILGPSTSNILPQLNLQGLLAIAWEWLVLVALTLWIGILVMEACVLEPAERVPSFVQVRKQALPLQWLCLAALLFGELINLVLRATLLSQTLGSGGIDPAAIGQLVLETNYGHLWLVRLALIGLALGFLWWTTRRHNNAGGISLARHTGRSNRAGRFSYMRQQVTQQRGVAKEDTEKENLRSATTRTSPSWQAIAWLTIAGLILLTLALSGDAAQLAQTRITAVVMSWLYLAAQGIWLGGAAYLAFVLLPLLPVIEPDHHGEALLTLLKRSTPLLLVTLSVLLVSFLFLGESSISNVSQLIDDPYGRTLLVKTLLIALMLILSCYTLFFLHPKLTRQTALLPVVDAELPVRRTRQFALGQTERGLKRTMNVLSCLGAGVLLCAALMSFFAPPIVFPAARNASSTSTTGSTTNVQTKTVGNLSVTLQVMPARVNATNIVLVMLKDSSGSPVTDAQVELTTNMEVMDMGTAHKSIAGGDPAYVAVFVPGESFSMAGLWDILVKISRPGQQPVQVVFQVMLNG